METTLNFMDDSVVDLISGILHMMNHEKSWGTHEIIHVDWSFKVSFNHHA